MTGLTLNHPQEIEVFYLIPALKRHLAVRMKERGLKQVEIAHLLSVEEAAVSQYLSNKRGNKISFDSPVVKEIEASADRITDQLSMLREMQRLLRYVRFSGALCKIHKQLSNIPSACHPDVIHCFGGKT